MFARTCIILLEVSFNPMTAVLIIPLLLTLKELKTDRIKEEGRLGDRERERREEGSNANWSSVKVSEMGTPGALHLTECIGCVGDCIKIDNNGLR